MTIDLDLQGLARALNGEISGDQVVCPGPGHTVKDRSLSVRLCPDDRDGFVVHSHAGDDWKACRDFVRDKLGLPSFAAKAKGGWGKPVASYVYKLADGTPHLLVRKFVDGDCAKRFAQSHWDGAQWASGKPRGEKIPYRLPELLAAPPSATVYVVECEKDVDALARLSFTATTNSEGAGKWTKDLDKHFRGRNVVILPDNDLPGRRHAETVARSLTSIASQVRIVVLPDLPLRGDVSDWLVHDPSGARLVKECERAPNWQGEDKAKIGSLAAMDKLGYGRARKEEAKALGVTTTELDKIVADARTRGPKEQERWKVEAWERPVSTATLLASLVAAYEKHVVLPPHGATAMALWGLHAWALDASYVSPLLMFASPEPRCGKSTALALIFRTAPRTSMASNISAAAVYRYVESLRPTLVLDESETYFHDNEELRGVLNSGHTRDTAHVIRLVEEDGDYAPKEFSTWGPKAIASIGKLAATLRDRAIILPMKRRKLGEKITKLRLEDTSEFETLRRQAKRWAEDNIEALKGARPILPDGLNDRAQDNWEPLLAIAELAGDPWPALARKAALALAEDVETNSIRTRLLGDIQRSFAEDGADRMSSLALAARLAELAGKDEDVGPWAAFGKGEKPKPITPRQVAKLLSEFAIAPRTIRMDESTTAKGYLLAWFQDAFERYVSSSPPFPSVTPSQFSDFNCLDGEVSVTDESHVTEENARNQLKDKNCDGVTDRATPSGGKGVSGHVCAQCFGEPNGTEQQCFIGDDEVWLHPGCQRFYLNGGGQ